MGWRDKFKLPSLDDVKDTVKKGMEAVTGDQDEESSASTDQELSDLEQLTQMLNDPQKGPMFEAQLGMDISGAKENDGVVTKDEAVKIVAKFSEELVDGGYLEDVDSGEKKSHETELREELGDNVDSYDQLNSSQKDALLIFVVTPETQRQEAIQKAVMGGAFSYEQTDEATQDHNVVMVDPETGKVVDFKRPNMEETQAYTEVPTVPEYIGADNDIG